FANRCGKMRGGGVAGITGEPVLTVRLHQSRSHLSLLRLPGSSTGFAEERHCSSAITSDLAPPQKRGHVSDHPRDGRSRRFNDEPKAEVGRLNARRAAARLGVADKVRHVRAM